MDSASSNVVFSSTESASDTFDARPLRGSGIVTLLLGLTSVLALAGPYMWCIPVLTIVFAIIALRPARVPVAGKGIAVVGLGLALFFGSWAVASRGAADAARQQVAAEFAENWLDSLKQGQPEFSFEMTLEHSKRQSEGVDLKRYHETKVEPSDPMELGGPTFKNFQEKTLVKAVLSAGADVQWELDKLNLKRRDLNRREWVFRFRDASGTINEPVLVTMVASERKDGDVHWHVKDAGFAK